MQLYNHTRKLFQNGDVNIGSLKVMLTNGYTFAAAETDMTNATADQVSGNGWAVGGPALAGAAVTVTSTNESTLDANDVSVTATGGSIGPATGIVIYDSVESTPLFHFSYASQTAADGTPFNINWDALGIYAVQADA